MLHVLMAKKKSPSRRATDGTETKELIDVHVTNVCVELVLDAAVPR